MVKIRIGNRKFSYYHKNEMKMKTNKNENNTDKRLKKEKKVEFWHVDWHFRGGGKVDAPNEIK